MNDNKEFCKILEVETRNCFDAEFKRIVKSSSIVLETKIPRRVNPDCSGFARQFEKRKIKAFADKALKDKKIHKLSNHNGYLSNN